MVFYRKYRPQKIKELDSREVREKLYSVLGSSSVAHAYIFTGPKGLGKTSAARIVAKVVNCQRLVNQRLASSSKEKKLNAEGYTLDATIEPCNKCNQCKSITNGTNLDVLEIDGASNRGIDEIRDLREKVRLSPASARKKVYIIDEVHMLTQEAFNALLKTLEEPPSHVVFVLCTTEPHKVPGTIMSRCLHIQFTKATSEELVRSFARIALVEKLKFDKEALGLIASLSDGSFRDGAKILEEIALVAKRKKITKELVEKQYRISQLADQITKMIEILEKKNTKSGLELTSKLAEQGTDMRFFIEELVERLHTMLLAKVGIKIDSPRKTELTIEDIKHLIELLGKAISELKYAVLPQIPLELVIVEWGQAKDEISSPRRLNASSEPSGNTQSVDKKASLYTAASLSKSGSVRSMKSAFRAEVPHNSKTDIFWQELIDKVKLHNHSIAGVLRGCSVKSYDGKSLIIEAKFKFHKDKLNEPKTLEVLGEACKEITKKKIKIEILLKPAFAKASAGKGGERK